ncbi:unnamed protein product [Enterobius vermicularis]|uniref:Protein stum homolog n=1 Tax=Enterobius vermicularis TaxID=51028 RepID=A0A0N4V9R8_ENTVE|nr:unnamed protein product [Enterobius vermicularis]
MFDFFCKKLYSSITGNRRRCENKMKFGSTVIFHVGAFRRAIPVMPMILSGLCCLLNIFIPGSGTLLCSFSVLCCAKIENCSKLYSFSMNLLAALIQFVTFPLVVGCVWSVYWGVLFIMKTREFQ